MIEESPVEAASSEISKDSVSDSDDSSASNEEEEDSINELDLDEEGHTTSGVAIGPYKSSQLASPVVSQVHYYMDSLQ